MNQHLWILKQIARYKYLCVSQFYLLWYPCSDKTLYKHLNQLVEKGLIGKSTHKYHPKQWRVENIYILTEKWAEYLVKHNEDVVLDVNVTTRPKLLSHDYEHRKKTLTAQIIMDLSCDNLSINRFRYYHYFQKFRKPRWFPQTATKLQIDNEVIIPDSVAISLWASYEVGESSKKWTSQQLLFLIEIHNWHRVKKIVQQLKPYAMVIASWIAWSTFWLSVNPKILVLFEHESTLQSTLEIMSKDTYYTYLKDFYLFKTFEDFKTDANSQRVNLRKEKVTLLESSTEE